MLGVPLFTAEALLRFCEWSKEALRIEWARDPVQTCLRAGLTPPYSALRLAQPQQQSQYVQYRTASGRQGRSSVQSITIVIPRPLRTQCITIATPSRTGFLPDFLAGLPAFGQVLQLPSCLRKLYFEKGNFKTRE